MSRPYKKGGKGGGGATKAVKHSTPCRFYQRGRCNNPGCPYLHVKAAPGSESHKANAAAKTLAPQADVIATMLKLFFEKHQTLIYNSENRVLDLSAFATKGELASIAASMDFNTGAFCQALCMCITDLINPLPCVIIFDNNGMKTIHQITRAMEKHDLHRSLNAVSFASNQITSASFTDDLKNFTSLAELNMLQNPVTEQEDYKARVKKHLPFLILLDTVPLSAPPLALPWPIFYHHDGAAGVAPDMHTTRYYDTVQRDILHFVQTAVLNPLEQDPSSAPSGTVCGVDAVSEAYALNATLTFSLTCPDAAVSTPMTAAAAGGKGSATAGLRSMVREIVGFRIRQTESNHNMERSGKKGGSGAGATAVATGRTQVCAQLEHWLYPKAFAVAHYIHASPNVAVLDNNGFGPSAPAELKVPVSVVTLHGVIIWRYRAAAQGTSSGEGMLIKRNFTRVMTVVVSGEDKWQIANDFISLSTFTGVAEDADDASSGATAATATEGSTEQHRLTGTGNNLDVSMLADLHPYHVVFSPAIDARRAGRMARRFHVPIPVVATISRVLSSDVELAGFLFDLQGIGLEVYEQLAQLAEGNATAAVYLARLYKCWGVDPSSQGLQLLTTHGLNWPALEAASKS